MELERIVCFSSSRSLIFQDKKYNNNDPLYILPFMVLYEAQNVLTCLYFMIADYTQESGTICAIMEDQPLTWALANNSIFSHI